MATLLFILLFGCLYRESAGQNIALQKATKQISDFTSHQIVLGSQLAVDGHIQQNNYIKTSCAHTKCNHTTPWWAVDFGRAHYIERVIIYGRTDCCEKRLADFDILFYNPSYASWNTYDKQQGKLCYRQNGESPTTLNVTCGIDIRGRYLKILKKRVYGVNCDCLTLCEVQVFGGEAVEHEDDENISTGIKDDDKHRRSEDSSVRNIVTTTQSEPICPCACSYKQKLDYWAHMDIPNHTMEEWRQILAPVLEKLDKELRINKTELSTSRRKKISANDNRKSAQRLGIMGVVFLSTVISLVVYIDVVSVWNGLKTTSRMRSRVRNL